MQSIYMGNIGLVLYISVICCIVVRTRYDSHQHQYLRVLRGPGNLLGIQFAYIQLGD